MPFDISDQFSKEPLTPEQLTDIPQPTLELTRHVAIKGLQAGALLGTVGASLNLLRRRPLSAIDAVTRVGRTASTAALVTAPLSVAAMAVVLQREGWNPYRIWDRAYRLRHNPTQQRVDRLTGIAAGLGALALQAPPFAALGVGRGVLALGGAALGSTLGVAGHVVTMPQEEGGAKAAVKSGVVAVETVGKEVEQPNPPHVKKAM